uniref:Uncharacterized protein n=1 Tax=Romanomermis culicivorax TaxID=13658 RepID=A0A915KDY6_ROMCU
MNPVTKHPEFYVQNLRLVSTPYDQSKVQEFVETFDKKALSRNLPNILDLFKELDEFEELIPPRPNQKPLRCPPPYNPRMARPNQYGPFGACVGQVQAQFPPAVVPTPVTLPLSQQKQQQHQMLADLNRPPQTPLSCNSMPQTPGSSSSNARSPKMRHMSTTSDTYGELETLQSLSHSFQSDMGSSQTHQNTPMGGLGSSSADSDSSSCAVTPVVESRATSVGGGCGQSSIAAATPLNDFPHHGERKSSLQDTIDSVVLATVSSANPQPSMSVNSPIMTSASSHDFSPRRRPSEASSVFDLRQTPSEDLIITSPTPSSAPVCGVAQPPPMMMGASGSTSSGQHLPSSQIQRTQRAASISLPSQQQQQAALDVFEFDQAAEQQQQQLYDPMGGSGSNVVVPTPHHRWSAPNIGVIGGYGGEPDFQANCFLLKSFKLIKKEEGLLE